MCISDIISPIPLPSRAIPRCPLTQDSQGGLPFISTPISFIFPTTQFSTSFSHPHILVLLTRLGQGEFFEDGDLVLHFFFFFKFQTRLPHAEYTAGILEVFVS